MAWKLVLNDVHGQGEPREVHALQVRFMGDCAEISKTDSTIEIVNMNEVQLSTWTRQELWDDLRKLAGGKLWHEQTPTT